MASRLSLFLAELKRRKVGRVAAAYAAVGTAIAVAVPDVFATMLVPAWAARLTIIVLLLGFPVALVLAWAVEITPEGIKRTGYSPAEDGVARAPERWSPSWMGFVAAAVFIALGAGYWIFIRGGKDTAADTDLVPNRILVTLFENQTGDSALDPAERMAADFIIRDLVTTGVVEVLPLDLAIALERGGQGEGVEALSSQDVARNEGAAYMVSGSFFAQGDSLVVQGQILDVAEGRIRTVLGPIHTSRAEPGEGMTDLAQRASGALAAYVDPSWSSTFSDFGPAVSFAAFAEMVAGADAFMNRDMGEAAERFTRAFELDSTYLAPLLMKSVALRNMGQQRAADSVRLVAEGFRDQANPLERAHLDLQKGWYEGDREAAYRAVQRAAALQPGGSMTFQWGYEAVRTNRLHQAVEALEGMDPGRPDMANWVSYWNRLNSAYHLLGDHGSELDAALRGRRQLPDDPWPVLHEALARLGLGEIDEALTGLDEFEAMGGGTPAVFRGIALDFRAHGHPEVARRILEEVLEAYDAGPDDPETQRGLRSGRAQTLYFLERWTEAEPIFSELRAEDPENYVYLGFLGAISARLGHRETASSLSGELAALEDPYLLGSNTRRRARIAALLGDSDGAVRLLQQAQREGMSFGLSLHREMDLESLRGHPGFEEFMRPRG